MAVRPTLLSLIGSTCRARSSSALFLSMLPATRAQLLDVLDERLADAGDQLRRSRTDSAEIWSSEPRIASRSSLSPPTKVRKADQPVSCSSRSPMWSSTALRLSISSPMTSSRSARVG